MRKKILVIVAILLLAFVGLCFLGLELSELFAGVEGAAIDFLVRVLVGFYNIESLGGYLSAAAAVTADSRRRRTRPG